MKNKINTIQGQQIKIIELNLSIDAGKSVLLLKFELNNSVVSMIFYNVSDLTINNFSMPFQICGFEIVDNKSRGWDDFNRYTVNDFEDGKIKFNCENFQII